MYHLIKNFFFALPVIVLLHTATQVSGQGVGVSFSYFIPKDGYFSAPISPFSLRGVGIDLNRYLAIETGFTLYRMSGLSIKDVPFEVDKPVIGPNFTILTPLELVIQFIGQTQEFKIKGGGFAFVGIATKLNHGNLDRALRDFEQWDVLNSDFDHNNKIGTGFQFGLEYVVYFSKQFGVSLGANYYIGDADLELTGSYIGGTTGGSLQTVLADYQDSKVDFTGLEISLGIIFTSQ